MRCCFPCGLKRRGRLRVFLALKEPVSGCDSRVLMIWDILFGGPCKDPGRRGEREREREREREGEGEGVPGRAKVRAQREGKGAGGARSTSLLAVQKGLHTFNASCILESGVEGLGFQALRRI